MPKTSKQHLGARAEDAAAGYLENKGYEILERNVRRPWGEIDIIAKRGKMLVFVEVKALQKYGGDALRPEDHLTGQKLHRFKRACELYIQGQKPGSYSGHRMDVVAMDFDDNGAAEIRHIEGIEV